MKHFVPLTHSSKKLLLFLLFLLLAFISYIPAIAQCTPTAPAAAACSGGNGAATSNTNISSGQTYWFAAGPATLGNVNINGGTLRICGTLTLPNLNINSGSIIIESGGFLTMSGGGYFNMSGNTTIINRGTLTIDKNVRLQNSNNIIWNESPTSIITVTGTFEINSATSKLINNGLFTAAGLTIQSASAGSICTSDNSIIRVGSLTNNITNSLSYSGSGTGSCLSITGNALLNNNLTNSSAVKICRASGSTTSGGAGWGSAMVSNNCTSCMALLPVKLEYFKALVANNLVQISWKTGEEAANQLFIVERSTDGIHFEAITQLYGQRGVSVYSIYDATPFNGKSYYRLKQVDRDGTITYSETVQAKLSLTNEKFVNVYPNPVTAGTNLKISISAGKAENISLQLTDMNGRIIFSVNKNINAGYNELALPLTQVQAGNYLLQCNGTSLGNIHKKITVIR